MTIAVLPASSACGSDAPRIAIGQLKGTITVTTPRAWYDTSVETGIAPGTGGSVLDAISMIRLPPLTDPV